MDKLEKSVKRKAEDEEDLDAESDSLKSNLKSRVKKRKRADSGSSSELEDALPENALEVEKSLHASAVKNNLDDEGVKMILKKVVTNDHVLALVKIREQEEEAASAAHANAPKLTRAKAKELMKASPNTAPWSLELTPIKQLPVKTRPEVKALIAQELPEDEDDEEYEPTNDDVPSDDDQTIESCSDVDSQPRTPATPHPSPKVVQDGPFKVPQATTPARRKLDLHDEEATIALRTRSKINLSSTTIEHIESAFVPPDDLPPPRDEEWDQFLCGVFDPAPAGSSFREDDDPDEDPEYNAAADPDANEEDDLDGSILRISKKELNDLVTELFSIMPEAAAADELASHLAQDVLQGTQESAKWEGKQEQISDEEKDQQKPQEKRDSNTRYSIGKNEPDEKGYREIKDNTILPENVETTKDNRVLLDKVPPPEPPKDPTQKSTIDIVVEESYVPIATRDDLVPPPLLQSIMVPFPPDQVVIRVDEAAKIEFLPAHIQILQQQLRQHIQLAASNFLQLFVNPQHWSVAPQYKQYLEQLQKMSNSNPHSVTNVCNLKPALDLVCSWEKTVSEDTPENKKMVEFIQKEADRSRRRFHSSALYAGEFHETFKRVVANSSVFLYPYLLPAMPYRCENYKKFGYRRSEDELMAMGLDQFWQYLELNPHLYKRKAAPNPRTRAGLNATANLVCKYMFPWMTPKLLLCHIARVRKDKDNPIQRFFDTGEIKPLKHKLLPFNPDLTLYEQPEHEMPRIWVRYLAKNSKRFRDHLMRRRDSGLPPIDGVLIDIGSQVEAPKKTALPIDFTKTIISNRSNVRPKTPRTPLQDKFDLEIENFELYKTQKENGLENETQRISNENSHNNASRENIRSDFDRNTNTAPKIMTIDSGKIVFNNILSPADKLSENSATPSVSNNAKLTEKAQDKHNTTGPPMIAQNLFKLVETSTGSFLVPLTLSTTTVNSIQGPISSTLGSVILNNDLPETETKKKDDNHCKCCLLLRKICKQQTKITDFFSSKIEKKCQCTDRKYPNISKRLKMLLNNFKNKSWCTHRQVQQKLNLVKKECHDGSAAEEDIDVQDIAYVTSYQLKLINRVNMVRNNYIKHKVNNMFSKFDTEEGNVMWLTEELFNALEVDLVDMYKEFLGFLTAEQAEKLDKFKEYFTQSCVEDLLKKIEAEISDNETKKLILSRLSAIFFDAVSTSCELCSSLLDVIPNASLAQYVFSLFPHRAVKQYFRVAGKTKAQKTSKQPKTPITKETETTEENVIDTGTRADSETDGDGTLTIDENRTFKGADYEADLSDSDERENMTVVENSTTVTPKVPETESQAPPNFNPEVSATFTVTKTEYDGNESDGTEMSALILSEDEVKLEPTEWTRDEDKIVLQLLLQHLSPEKREGKTVMEVLRETNLYEVIADSLSDKSDSDIKERVMYLMEILVLTDS